jgi:methionyl-tRNA formyltransferase
VDKGIDTGSIIYQDTTEVKIDDNFITYPLHQYALAIPLLKQALEDIALNKLKTYKKENAVSKLYYHPTFTKYISGLLFKGLK